MFFPFITGHHVIITTYRKLAKSCLYAFRDNFVKLEINTKLQISIKVYLNDMIFPYSMQLSLNFRVCSEEKLKEKMNTINNSKIHLR